MKKTTIMNDRKKRIRFLRSLKTVISIFLFGLLFTQSNVYAQITSLPYSQGFEGATHGWTLTSGTTDGWYVGSAVAESGSKSMYVSNNGGVSNNYTGTSTIVVHAYKDFVINNSDEIALEYSWKGVGESSFDYLRVWLVPISYTPVLNSQIAAGAGRIDISTSQYMNQQTTWKREQNIINVSGFNGSFRLVFEWRNDSSVINQPPSAIDNINISGVTCSRPSDVSISEISKESVLVTVTPASNSPLNSRYEYEVRTSGLPGSGATGLVTAGVSSVNPFQINGLQPLTQYLIYVKTLCTANDISIWTRGFIFTTKCDYPNLITAPGVTLCGPQETDLTAIFDSGIIAWYDAKEDGNLLHTGAIFRTPIINANTSFWVEAGNMVSKDTIAQIGAGALTSKSSTLDDFLYHGYGGVKYQHIYTAQELINAGLEAGEIYGIEYNVIDTGTANRNFFTMSLGTTTQGAATGTHVDNSLLSQVYYNASETFVSGTKYFNFDTPYFWDGVSNLVVQVAWTNMNTGGTTGTLAHDQTAASMVTYSYGDNKTIQQFLATNSGAVAGSGSTGTTNKRPQTKFYLKTGCTSVRYEVPVIVNPLPSFELSDYKVVSCSGNPSELVTIATNLGGYDIFEWSPLQGVTGNHVSGWRFNVSQEQVFTLTARQTNGICKMVKKVIVSSPNNPTPDSTLASNFTTCVNEIIELKAYDSLPSQVEIGLPVLTTGITSGMSAFVYSNKYSRQQYIYSASELNALGLNKAGYINQLILETINSGASLSSANYVIRMKQTGNTSFATTSFDNDNFTTVYSKVNQTHTFQGQQTFNFDLPFYWDGISNIILEILQEGGNASGTNNAETYYHTANIANVGIYTTNATEQYPLTGTRAANRLNVKFGIEQAEVKWSPATNLYLDAAGTIQYTLGTKALKVYMVSGNGGNYIYNAIIDAPTGCQSTIPVNVNVVKIDAPVIQNQTFCNTISVQDIVISNAVNGVTYNFYSSATSTTPITNISQTGTYYVEGVIGSCKSARSSFVINITLMTLPTTSQTIQIFCGTPTIADLVINSTNGAHIKWYDSPNGTQPLPLTQPLLHNTTYYATQSLGVCESGRLGILVQLTSSPPALQSQTISFCGSIHYGSINLNQLPGAELHWYPSSSSQQAIPNNSLVVSGTYYVSQFLNGCESQRTQIIVTAQGNIPNPVVTAHDICGSGTVSMLVARGLPNAILEWFDSSTSNTPLSSNTPLRSGTYYVSQRVDNCSSNRVPFSVRLNSVSAPTAVNFDLCEGATIANLNMPNYSGITYNWYETNTSSVVLASTEILQTGYYFVTKVENGCESPRTQIRVTINQRPAGPIGVSPQIFTDYAEISNIIMNQTNVIWYATYNDAINDINRLNQNMPLVTGSTYYAVIFGTNGCASLPVPIEIVIVLNTKEFDLAKLNYHPNPVEDILTIKYEDNILGVDIYDLNGRLISERKFNDKEILVDLMNLSSGTYMVKIQTINSSQFIKIIKK